MNAWERCFAVGVLLSMPACLNAQKIGAGAGCACAEPVCAPATCAATTCAAPTCEATCEATWAAESTSCTAPCGDCGSCGLGNFCSKLDGLFCGAQKSRITFSGWLDGGIIGNFGDPPSRYNGPYNAVDRSNQAMFNQLYLIAEAALPQCGTGIGGRVDVLYGQDYFLAQSRGFELRAGGANAWNPASQYMGLAIPQAYGEVGNQQLSVKVGHFYSIVGYEGIQSTNNFFYSHSYSYQFATPFTHWGSLATWRPSEAWTIQAGITNGWDALDRTTDRPGYLAGVKYQGERIWTSFALTTGQDFNNLAALPGVVPQFTNRTRYSYLLGAKLTCKLDYVFHQWLGVQGDALANGQSAEWYGIDQYLYYTVNKCLKWGARVEWFHDDDGTRVGLNRVANPNNPPFVGDFYSLTFGANYMPYGNTRLILRPEIRHDWYNAGVVGGPLPFRDGASTQQTMVGFDAIATF
jgi:hypothetical protein